MTPRTKSNAPSSGYAVAYLRVSTDEQSQSGLGLEAQAASIEQAARRHRLTIRATFTDAGVSGAKAIDKRPQLAAALAAIQRGDVLLIAKRDRLARDMMHVAVIEAAARKKKARIVSAAGEGTDDDDPSSFMLRGMIDVFAAYERMVIRHRTSAALQQKVARGEFTGTAPYGWKLASDGRTLEPNPAEAALAMFAAEARYELGFTWEATAAALNERGYRNRAGNPWTFQTVRSMLLTWSRRQELAAPPNTPNHTNQSNQASVVSL